MKGSKIYTIQEVDQIAKNILDKMSNTTNLLLLTGDLGAGKTTLIQTICKQLNVIDEVNSPTFSIINEYKTETNESIFHLDLYRLKDENEALDIGIEDYLYDDNYTFIEWPEIIESLLPDNLMRIHIENIDNSTRKILFL